MTEQRRIGAVILAAGKSERMMYPKPLLIFGKETVVDRIIRVCLEAGCDPVVVVLGHESERIRANSSLAGSLVVVNEAYETGQTSSLQAGLRALPEDASAFVLFPVDHALVMTETVELLIASWREGGGALVAPVHAGRRGHPVLCDRALIAEFAALDPGAPAHLVTGADPARVRAVETDDAEVLRDLDAPSDYHAALEVYSERGGEAGFLAPRGTGGRALPKKPPV